MSQCGNPLLTIADEFQQQIDDAKLFWQTEQIEGASANVASFKDGSFNFNQGGYLVESKDKLNKHNKIPKDQMLTAVQDYGITFLTINIR